MNLDKCISIPQISFNHFYNNKCLDKVSEVGDITLAYLNKFIVGGRCMSAYNRKYSLEKIADFDANSLFRWALCRNDFVIPLGNPRKIKQEEIDNFNKDL